MHKIKDDLYARHSIAVNRQPQLEAATKNVFTIS